HRSRVSLHSFPTRRSSDLSWRRSFLVDRIFAFVIHVARGGNERWKLGRLPGTWPACSLAEGLQGLFQPLGPFLIVLTQVIDFPRSEEHTSELQSRGHLVCR